MQRHLCSSFNSINDCGSSYLFIFPVHHPRGSRALLLFFAAITIFVVVGFCLSVSAKVVYGPKCAVNRLYNKNRQFLYFHLAGIIVQYNINSMSNVVQCHCWLKKLSSEMTLHPGAKAWTPPKFCSFWWEFERNDQCVLETIRPSIFLIQTFIYETSPRNSVYLKV